MRTILLKLLLLGFALYSGRALYALRLEETGQSMATILYAVLFVASCLPILCSAWIANNAVRLLWAAVFAISFVFGEASQRIVGDYVNYSYFVQLMSAKGFIGDAIQQFAWPIGSAMLAGVLLFLGIALHPGERANLGATISSLVVLGFFLVLTVLVYLRGGAGTGGLPSSYLYPPYLALLGMEAMQGRYEARESVTLPLAAAAGRDLVLIVDESVRGDYLDINAAKGVYSALERDWPGTLIENLGLAVSVSNCSTQSNLGLRYGGTRENYLQMLYSKPSIWAYARSAGMTPVYVDGQRTGGDTQNDMLIAELDEIERLVQFDDVDVVNRDMAIADVLVELLENDTTEFIYVNKVGAHFPIADKYPADYEKYRPALPRERFDNIANASLNDEFGGAWDLYKNSYKNTLLWGVGAFFESILGRVELGENVIIYTSDHGQDFHERGNPGLSPHCSPKPNVEEGIVPMVLLRGSGRGSLFPGDTLAQNHNRSSHFNLFPTMLRLMGYEAEAVSELYGSSLFERVGNELSFNTRFRVQFGKKPTWRTVRFEEAIGID